MMKTMMIGLMELSLLTEKVGKKYYRYIKVQKFEWQ